MRSRPKQVNYLSKHGQQREVGTQQAGGVGDNNAALRDADRIINKNANRPSGLVPKKPSGVTSRSSRPAPARGSVVEKPKNRNTVQEDRGVQGKIQQFISLDDIQDSMSGYEIPQDSNSGGRMGGDGIKPARSVLEGGGDYWAQPVMQPRAAPSSAGEHFGRPLANLADQMDHWGMPQMGVRNAAKRLVSPLVVQEARATPESSDNAPQQRIHEENPPIRQPLRRNGEYDSNTHASPRAPDVMLSPRMDPPQNVIPRMPTMRPMQQSLDADDIIGGYSVPAPSYDDNSQKVDHGFSPPPKAKAKKLAAAAQHSFGQEPSPRMEAPVGVVRKRPPPLPAMADGNRADPPALPSHRNQPRRFIHDDKDEWRDEVQSNGDPLESYSDAYALQRGGASEWSANEYDEDSVDQSPRRRKPDGIPLVRNVHPNANFTNKYTSISTSDVMERERNLRGRQHKGGVGKKAAPLVSPRASLEEVNTHAPPLPFDGTKALKAYGSEQEHIPLKDKLHYSKAPRKVEYKPYTLADYKQIKGKGEYQDIPKLQPDLNTDALIAKRANQQRVKEFSKQLKEFNRAELQHEKDLKAAPGRRSDAGEKKAPLSKRERALEYGKKVRSKAAAVHHDAQTAAKPRGWERHGAGGYDDWHGEVDPGDDSYVQAGDPTGQEYDKVREIEELETKHNDGKRQIDAIKRALKL